MTTSRFWHGFADMHVVKDREVVISSGDGATITDTNGKTYIDATAALWFCNVGYGRKEIADAVAEQLTRLHGYSSFGSYTTDATLRAAERLTALSPIPNAVVFLASGGSDAIDTAGKLARRYWDVVGKPNKTLMVSREHAYHGMHALGTSLGGMPIMQAGYGGEPFVNEVVRVPALDVEAAAKLFEQRRDEIALFVGEPVIGAGGVIPPTETYWRDISALCRQYDVLLVADEVITGFGRTGRMWGTQRYDIKPDMITFAKGVTSGTVPMAGVIMRKGIYDAFMRGRRSGTSPLPVRCSATATPIRGTPGRPRRRWPTSTSSNASAWSIVSRRWSRSSTRRSGACRARRWSERSGRSGSRLPWRSSRRSSRRTLPRSRRWSRQRSITASRAGSCAGTRSTSRRRS